MPHKPFLRAARSAARSAAYCALVLSLGACGGGNGDGASAPAIAVSNPATLVITDKVAGTGATAINGSKLTVRYTGWYYSAAAADHKGPQFETGAFTFTLGSGAVIAGWDQGLPGMRAGGIRSLAIPSALAYGSTGRGPIPPNAGLLFEVELSKVE